MSPIDRSFTERESEVKAGGSPALGVPPARAFFLGANPRELLLPSPAIAVGSVIRQHEVRFGFRR